MITFAHSGHDYSAELIQAVANTNGSSALDVAYVVYIVSFFIAGSILIYLLLDKIKHNRLVHVSKSRVIKPKKAAGNASAKTAPKRSTSSRKSSSKKTAKKK